MTTTTNFHCDRNTRLACCSRLNLPYYSGGLLCDFFSQPKAKAMPRFLKRIHLNPQISEKSYRVIDFSAKSL